MLSRRMPILAGVLVCAMVAARPIASSTSATLAPAVAEIPSQLTDKEFWALSASLSEPAGSFRSENLVSNETMYQWVIPDLVKTVKPGGVYLGVAPDQNFTYIVATKPKIALIVDIRRGNVLQHLLYKALIEMSADRVEFLSRLFSCARPAGVAANAPPRELLEPFYEAKRNADLFDANQQAVIDWLEKHHGFTLSASDEEQLRWIYSAFFADGPELTYSWYQNRAWVPSSSMSGGIPQSGVIIMRNPGAMGNSFTMPIPGAYAGYGDLQMQSDAEGVAHAYLASESNFAWLKAFETKNLIVPFTGDFAGPKALKSAGAWVRDHGATVTAIYTSNVEQYLFQQGNDWSRYYENVAALPIDESSTFIRSIPNMMVTPNQPGARAASMLCSVSDLVKAFTAGKIQSYPDIAVLCRQAAK